MPNPGIFVPIELGTPSSQHVIVFTNPEDLHTLYFGDFFFTEASSCRYDQSLTQFPAPLFFLKHRGDSAETPEPLMA